MSRFTNYGLYVFDLFSVFGRTCIAVAVDVLSVGKCKAEPSIVAIQLFTFHLFHLPTVNCLVLLR